MIIKIELPEVDKVATALRRLVNVEERLAVFQGAQLDPYFDIITSFDGITFQSKRGIQMASLKEGQFIDVRVVLKTKAGHPGGHEAGTEQFETSDPAVASVGPIPGQDPVDPLTARLTGVDGSGNTPGLLTFTADGDPSQGTKAVVATLDYVVNQGDAVIAEIQAGEPQDVPAETPAPAPTP